MLRLARWVLFAAVRPFGLTIRCWDGSNGTLNGGCPVQPASDVSGVSPSSLVGADPLPAPSLESVSMKVLSDIKPQEPMKQPKGYKIQNQSPAGLGLLALLAGAVIFFRDKF